MNPRHPAALAALKRTPLRRSSVTMTAIIASGKLLETATKRGTMVGARVRSTDDSVLLVSA
jgi:hypothetical protein